MPLTDSTKAYINKENVNAAGQNKTMTPKQKLAVQLEGKMREPMDHKVEEIRNAVR